MFENCSFDYNDIHMQWKGNTSINLVQCHLEHGSGTVPVIQGLDGSQGGGVALVQCDFVSASYNNYTSYVSLKGRNFFDADQCYFSNVRGITDVFAGNYTTRELTGTVACTANSATVTGTGTSFTTALAVGDLLTFRPSGGWVHLLTGQYPVPRLKVKSIESNTSFTLDFAFPALILIGHGETEVAGTFTGAVLTASTKAANQEGRVRCRNSKFAPNAFNDQVFMGGDPTKNYIHFDATGGAPFGFVEQAGNFVIASGASTAGAGAKPSWAAGLVTVRTNNDFPIPTGTSPVNISGMTPAGYNGTHNATRVDSKTFTYPLAIDPGVVADGMTSGRVNMGAAFGHNYGIRLGTGFGLTVVSNGGYLEFRKNANYAGTNCAFWMFIPVPSAPFRNVVFGFDEVALGAVGNVHVITRWGSYPNLAYSGYGGTIPDDSMYNTNFADPGGYTPSSVESTRIFSVPEYAEWSAAPENATHFVVKFNMGALNNYVSGTTVYKIRNIRLSLF
jgi:hypothetical protein